MFLGNLKKMEGFDTVHHVLVLRDAETNIQNAINMVQKAFRVSGLPIPDTFHKWKTDVDNSAKSISTGFTLMPECSTNPTPGALEDLCWKILKDQHASEMREDVQSFINAIKDSYGSVSTHEHKSRLHTYFSINEKYISLKIGEAAKAGAFSWDSSELDGLKKIIADGFL